MVGYASQKNQPIDPLQIQSYANNPNPGPQSLNVAPQSTAPVVQSSGGPAPVPQAHIIPPGATGNPQGTLAERFAANNVFPFQPGMDPLVSLALANLYRTNQIGPAIQAQDQIARNQAAISGIQPPAALPTTSGFGNTLSQTIPSATGDILASTAVGAAGGATTGALAGLVGGPAAPVTVPAAAGIGALVGGAGGFINGLRLALNDLKKQQEQDIQAQQRPTDARRALRNIVNGVNTGLLPADEALTQYHNVIAQINQAERNLKAEPVWLGKPERELRDIANFNTYEKDFYTRKLFDAINQPNAANILPPESEVPTQ